MKIPLTGCTLIGSLCFLAGTLMNMSRSRLMSDAFRRGFLYGIASRGLTPSSFGELVIEKKASITGFDKGLMDLAPAVLSPFP
jgi:hypothetical protein